jgi:hypothetical protein
MQVPIVMFVLVGVLGIAALAAAAIYLWFGYRVINGFRVFLRFHGSRLVTCPEIRKAAVIQVAARSAGLQAILDEPSLRVSDCSCWPMCRKCGQHCLRQIA